MSVSLAIVKEYKRNRISHYNIEYVEIENHLEIRLKNILRSKINGSNSFEEYTYDCAEPEGGSVKTINYESTDFYNILEELSGVSPEENKINSVEDLIKAKSYIIILNDGEDISIAGFKHIPINWKLQKSKGLIPLLFENNTFKDLDTEDVFNISNTVDFIYFEEEIFILSKKDFERGLNFRDGMIAKADAWYEKTEGLDLFINLDILKDKIGNNIRYLRKIASIENLGYYNDQQFLKNVLKISKEENWGITFDNNKIVITEDSLDAILTVLQNKRLYSKLTEENFDVESAKLFNSSVSP
jgi:hypothetical protein